MADYYSVLSRAISHLEGSSVEARQPIYDRARQALKSHLGKASPPIAEDAKANERKELEDAIKRIEFSVTSCPSAEQNIPRHEQPGETLINLTHFASDVNQSVVARVKRDLEDGKLMEIYRKNNRIEWTNEAFVAIHEILVSALNWQNTPQGKTFLFYKTILLIEPR